MIDMKEIKSVKIVPYTLITSLIAAIFAFIYAILSLISTGISVATTPMEFGGLLIGLSVAMIIVSPVSSFVFNIPQAFLSALVYNILVPRLGGIKLEMEDLSEIKSVPIVQFALITSAVSAILALIIALIIVPFFAAYVSILAGVMSSVSANLTSTTVPNISGLGALGTIGSIILIIGIPVGTFIISFIAYAIIAIIYNFITPKIGGIKFEFALVREEIFELKIIEIIPFALVTATIAAVIGFIIGIIILIISLIGGLWYVGVIALLGFTIGAFIGVFIMYAILALVYNYISPKIGGIQLELE